MAQEVTLPSSSNSTSVTVKCFSLFTGEVAVHLLLSSFFGFIRFIDGCRVRSRGYPEHCSLRVTMNSLIPVCKRIRANCSNYLGQRFIGPYHDLFGNDNCNNHRNKSKQTMHRSAEQNTLTKGKIDGFENDQL